MDKILFQKEILKHFNCDQNIFEKIEIYKKLLIEYNKKYNLTRLDIDEKIYLNYFFESIIVYKDILNKNDNYKLLDIGSGSGIPGILIKLFFPNIEITIIESNQKKCKFIKLLINELNLSKINVLNKRAEEININEREAFDFVTSRAVAKLKVLLEISAPYLKVNGYLIEPKSNKLELEIKESKEIINRLFLKKIELLEYNFFNRENKIIVFQKYEKTPLNFPRTWKEIIK